MTSTKRYRVSPRDDDESTETIEATGFNIHDGAVAFHQGRTTIRVIPLSAIGFGGIELMN